MKSSRPFTSAVYQWISTPSGKEGRPDTRALRDRAQRQSLPDTRDLTGRLAGDPPPGRSALDRKRAAEEAARLAKMQVAETEQSTSRIEPLAIEANGERDEA